MPPPRDGLLILRMKHLLAVLFHLPQTVLIGLVKGYRLLLSPWLGSACRFEPTCSVYSLQALKEYGAMAGSYLTLHRLVRCQPWCEGGHDPVPLRQSDAEGSTSSFTSLFTRLVTPVASIPSKKKPS